MQLTISRRDDLDAGSLTLVGSIDIISRQLLLDAGTEALDAGSSLTLDMSGVEFMDSTGIGALVQLAKHSEKLGREFVITDRSPVVDRVLQVSGLDRAWPGV